MRRGEGALHLVPGAWEGQPEACGGILHISPHAQPCRDPALSPSCAVTPAGAHGANPQTLGPSCCMVLQHQLSFPVQLAVVPQTWDCGFTSGWGSSIGWRGRGKELQGKLEGSESRQKVCPLQKTGRSQFFAFSWCV